MREVLGSLYRSPLWFGLVVLVTLYASKATQEAVTSLAIMQGLG